VDATGSSLSDASLSSSCRDAGAEGAEGTGTGVDTFRVTEGRLAPLCGLRSWRGSGRPSKSAKSITGRSAGPLTFSSATISDQFLGAPPKKAPWSPFRGALRFGCPCVTDTMSGELWVRVGVRTRAWPLGRTSSEAGSVSESDAESTDDWSSSVSESVPTSLSISSSLSRASLALPRLRTMRVFLDRGDARGLLPLALLEV
jgi:hypothetical protein